MWQLHDGAQRAIAADLSAEARDQSIDEPQHTRLHPSRTAHEHLRVGAQSPGPRGGHEAGLALAGRRTLTSPKSLLWYAPSRGGGRFQSTRCASAPGSACASAARVAAAPRGSLCAATAAKKEPYSTSTPCGRAPGEPSPRARARMPTSIELQRSGAGRGGAGRGGMGRGLRLLLIELAARRAHDPCDAVRQRHLPALVRRRTVHRLKQHAEIRLVSAVARAVSGPRARGGSGPLATAADSALGASGVGRKWLRAQVARLPAARSCRLGRRPAPLQAPPAPSRPPTRAHTRAQGSQPRQPERRWILGPGGGCGGSGGSPGGWVRGRRQRTPAPAPCASRAESRSQSCARAPRHPRGARRSARVRLGAGGLRHILAREGSPQCARRQAPGSAR